MSRRDNLKRIFVGNLPADVRTRDLEDLFYKFGEITFIDLKTRRGPPFAFVEFRDYRDAEEAVRCRHGKEWDGCRLRVEFPRGRERPSGKFRNGSGGSRPNAPQRRSKFRVKVSGLPSSGSWQDLKDHMREIGEVSFADVFKGGKGVVDFVNYDDMRRAIRKLNNTKFKSHEGESSYIELREDIQSGDSRSRSRSPVVNKRRGSPSYSPVARRRGDSHSPSRSQSRSPSRTHRKSGDKHKRSSRRNRSASRSRSPSKSASSRSRSRSRSAASRSPSRSPSRSRSRSPSASPRSERRASPAPAGPPSASPQSDRGSPRERSRPPTASPRSERGAASPRDRSRSKSVSRSPSYDKSREDEVSNK